MPHLHKVHVHKAHNGPKIHELRRKIEPRGLDNHAAAIAAEHGDKGGVVITFSEHGIRIGAAGLTAIELRQALNMAIHYSYIAEDAYVFEDKG